MTGVAGAGAASRHRASDRVDGLAGSGVEKFVALSKQPLLGRRRPPPGEIVIETAVNPPVRTSVHPPHAQHDDRHQRGALESKRHRRTGHGPEDEGEAQARHGEHREEESHRPCGDRHIEEGPRRSHRGDHQDEHTETLEPARPAEEQPPDDERQAPGDPGQHPVRGKVGRQDGTPNLATHCSSTITTPGHNRRGFARLECILGLDAARERFVQQISIDARCASHLFLRPNRDLLDDSGVRGRLTPPSAPMVVGVSARRVTDLRERADGPREHSDHRGHLRPSRVRWQSCGC